MASSTEKPTHENKLCFAVINNIPNDYHSADLRNYFSQFIERSGFDCFHFRHRPEKIQSSEGVPNSEQNQKLEVETLCRSKSSFCCVVRLDVDKVNELIRMYHRQHWLDRKGESIPRLCLITKLFVGDLGDQELQPVYRTRDEQKQADRERETFTRADLNKLPELHPPDIMPHGNVGTPTMIFLKFIRECRLPPIVIKKLGLSFPKTRTNKRYGNVPMDYGTNTLHNEQCELSVRTEKGHEIHSTRNSVLSTSTNTSSLKETDNQNQTVSSSSQQAKGGKRKHKRDKETKRRMAENIEEKMIEREKSEESEEDADGCEEWERHEALYDDPDNQERNKERLFEEKIELKWEKGGSGLVFYTDAQYWQEKEGDFDEQTADDWDVDMSAYYEDGAGDKDIRDYITIRQEQ